MNARDSLSKIWSNIQYLLFPDIEKLIGELSVLHKKLISVLELVRIEEFIPCTRFNLGRPPKNRIAIARSYIAKTIFKIPYTKQLVEYLKQDEKLRVICGWESLNDIPSESKFSRAFKEFAELSLPDLAHNKLINYFYDDQTIEHVVKDSTPIEVREKGLKKECSKIRKKLKDKERFRKKKTGELNRRQKQLQEENLDLMLEELPKHCDIGLKKSSQGNTMLWKGYKLHIAVDDNCIPLAAILTSASLNDSEVAIPLAIKADKVAKNFYDLMDAAYDHPEIKAHSISLSHVPIIDPCPHGKKQKLEKETEKKRKKILNFETSEDRRYKKRLPKERFNALYKDYHGGRTVFVRGYQKVFCHVMFGVLVLAAAGLMKLVQ